MDKNNTASLTSGDDDEANMEIILPVEETAKPLNFILDPTEEPDLTALAEQWMGEYETYAEFDNEDSAEEEYYTYEDEYLGTLQD